MKPKNTKFRKYHRPKLKNYLNHKNNLIYSKNAIIATQPSFISASQIQAIILKLKRILKRKGKIITRVFPHQSITKKPQEVRMGKGKGNVHQWLQPIKPGSIILELHVKSTPLAKIALKSISYKLPFKTKIINYIRTRLMARHHILIMSSVGSNPTFV